MTLGKGEPLNVSVIKVIFSLFLFCKYRCLCSSKAHSFCILQLTRLLLLSLLTASGTCRPYLGYYLLLRYKKLHIR